MKFIKTVFVISIMCLAAITVFLSINMLDHNDQQSESHESISDNANTKDLEANNGDYQDGALDNIAEQYKATSDTRNATTVTAPTKQQDKMNPVNSYTVNQDEGPDNAKSITNTKLPDQYKEKHRAAANSIYKNKAINSEPEMPTSEEYQASYDSYLKTSDDITTYLNGGRK